MIPLTHSFFPHEKKCRILKFREITILKKQTVSIKILNRMTQWEKKTLEISSL